MTQNSFVCAAVVLAALGAHPGGGAHAFTHGGARANSSPRSAGGLSDVGSGKADQDVLGAFIQKLFKDEGVNPLAGCLPNPARGSHPRGGCSKCAPRVRVRVRVRT